MMHVDFFKFLIAGIILGLPFGPVGILCMGKTIEEGKKNGFASAMGAVTVDVIYSLIAFYTLMQVKSQINEHEFILKVIVGIFLMVIGITKVFGKLNVGNSLHLNEEKDKKIEGKQWLKNYTKIFLISIPNVFNILTIITIFTALEIFNVTGSYLSIKIIIGILLGDALFWFITTTILGVLRNKINEKMIEKVVRGCGVMILLFGLSLLTQAILSKI